VSANEGYEASRERRRHKRIRARFIVTYKVNEPLEVVLVINKREISALMLDLSESGMALVSGVDIPAQTIMLMNFTLINTAAFQESQKVRIMDIKGEVRYNLMISNKEHRLGIRFTRISDDDREAIASFVRLSLDNHLV